MSRIIDTHKRIERIAGISFLLAIATVVISNYGINFRLIVPGNAAETAKNIQNNETLFRLNVACNLFYCIAIVVLLASLYSILKNINQTLALIAVFCRLLLVVTWCITDLNSLGALRLVGDTSYLTVFETAKLQTLARLHLASSYDAYYIGLPFWGLASAVCSYLFFRSKYIPGTLALFGLGASVWCVFCAFTFLVFPRFDLSVNASWFDMPMLIFEIVLGFWLLVKGLKRNETADMKN